MNHQDWTPVIFKKKAPKSAKDAKKRGFATKTVSKLSGNSKHKRVVNSKKMEEATEVFKIAKISTEVRKAIQNTVCYSCARAPQAPLCTRRVCEATTALVALAHPAPY